MSTAPLQTGSPPPPAPGGAADPSMEDILASIRRILSEDDAEPATPAEAPSPSLDAMPVSDVLTLDASMLVEEPPEPPPAMPVLRAEPLLPGMHSARAAEPPPLPPPAPVIGVPQAGDALLAPETAAAAATSMGSLLRTLVTERQMAVHRGGPTIEDLVREEIRPLLKQWLDTNLPPMVERLVRTEIERLVGRAMP